ncbi:MAG: hypothetical protein ACXVCY_18720 [Pseudobdellovibrionaceae bacterium]
MTLIPIVLIYSVLNIAAADVRKIPTNSKCAQAVLISFKNEKKFDKVIQTKEGVSYVMAPPGPCSCPMDSNFWEVSELKEYLKKVQKINELRTAAKCPPNQGCARGITQFYVQCGSVPSK